MEQNKTGRPIEDLQQVSLFDVSGWAAFKFGFFAAIGAAFVWVVVGVILTLLSSATGLIAWLTTGS